MGTTSAQVDKMEPYRVPHFQLEFEVVLIIDGEVWSRSLSMELLPLSEPVGDEARWK